ncbi:MAG: nitrous oxide reductase family maturation protein NosD [Flavobacteriaceae bacterium]|nr:nitrous oxide reductase family maturation protein NosD [Flavobacteriaceae bacterium]MDH3796209.1 nitrous oxide reductase family maturation protein NosD [Flavobacteriaceae bacterium]
MSYKWAIGCILFGMALVQAETIKVCATCTYSSIKEAVLKAQPYDTVLVEKGVYKEINIRIDKPLVLKGLELPVIDGEDKGEIITIVADDVYLSGFLIRNVGTSYTTDYAAVRVIKSKNFRIENLQLEKLFFGIYLEKSSYGKVINNSISGDAVEEYNSGNGIHLWHSNNIEVLNNRIEKVRDGIYLEFSDNILIQNNESLNNVRYGLHFMFSNDDSYVENLFENNGAGVAVMFSKNIRMTNNIFRNNWGPTSYGLLLKEIYDAEIKNNRFVKNTVGINIEGSNRILYSLNNFENNGWALKVKGACYANRFEQNNFLSNSFDISYNSHLNDNIFERNFWSSYTGYDLDKDGIGDVPYRPVKLFSYIVNRTPETIILLRSLFMDIINFSERVSPVFTPDNLIDASPQMKQI